MKPKWVALVAAGLALAVLAFAGTAGAASFVGTQTGPSEWTYTLTYDPYDNYATCPLSAPGGIATIWSPSIATITLSGLAGVVSATAPTSTDFTPLGGLLDTGNLQWTPQVLAGGTAVTWTHVGPGTGNFAIAKHVYGFKVLTAAPAPSGQVNVASSGFSTERGVSPPCPVQPANDRDFTGNTVGPVAQSAGFVVVAGSVTVTSLLGDPYFIEVSVVRDPDGRVTGFYRHSDTRGSYSVVEAQCIRLSPRRATIAGIVRETNLPNRIGTWAALAIDDRGGIVGPDRVISGVQGPNEGPFCPIPFSPEQIIGPWDEATSGDIVIRHSLFPPAAPDPIAVCMKGGFVDLFAQNGSGTAANPSGTFATPSACISWVGRGGTVGTLKPELISGNGSMSFVLTVSGAAPVGTSGVCGFDPELPLLVYYTSPRIGSGCLNPPVYHQPFQVLSGPCTAGQSDEMKVVMATASGGVVGRTVTAVCK